MRILVAATVLMTLVSLLGGCATYKVAGESFSSPGEALQKQAQIHAGIMAQIKSGPPIRGARALVLLPADGEIQRNHIRLGDNASKLGKESLDFLVTSVRNDFRFMADAITKRNIFESVAVAYHNGNPEQSPMGENEFLVFVDVGGWYVKKRAQARSAPVPVDPSQPVGAPRTLKLLDALHQKVVAMGGQ